MPKSDTHRSLMLLHFIKPILLLIMFILLGNTSFSQTQGERCFSDVDGENTRWQNPDHMYIPYYVNLNFHIIRRSNHTGGAPSSRVNEIMNHLHDIFYPHYIYFTNNDPIDYIDNDDLYELPHGDQNYIINGNNDAIDIYLYPEHRLCEGAEARCVGNANLAIIFSGTLKDTGIKMSEFAAPHEIGHMLGLPHTFEDAFGDEAVDGSDCDITGDRFCDTPASPARLVYHACEGGEVLGGLNDQVSPYPACQWLNPAYEENTNLLYQPLTDNIMDYTHPSCNLYFTTEQVKAMRAKIEGSTIIDDVVCSAIWGQLTYGIYTNTLQTVNFVSSQSIDVDVEALHTNSFMWQLISGTASFSTYNNGQEMSLYLNSGGSATFHVSHSNPCGIGSKSVTFIHSGGWYSVYSNPTLDCVELIAMEDYEISYIDENGVPEQLDIRPNLKSYKLVDLSGNVLQSKIFSGNIKSEEICLTGLKSGIYHLYINDGESDMKIEKIIKL